MAVASLREEVTDLLQELIRVNTVNPPGNETAAAELLRGYLEANGVACELYARTPDRANLVARLPGRGSGPRLLFLSHTDTVLADASEWSVDPWSGDARDGQIWGRGALDMKSQVAANAVAIASLAREGFEPAGDLIFAATADEEVGEDPDFGLSWLCREHPEAVRAEFAINEGGGDRIEVGGQTFYLCAAAEKMSSPFRLLVRGRSGHASVPSIADNALVKAARLIERLGEFESPPTLGPETVGFLDALLGQAPPVGEALSAAHAVDPTAAIMLEPLLAMTVSPTMIQASDKRNVIPALCEVTVDCRLLPGQTQADAERELRECLGDEEYEIEWRVGQGGTRSPLRTQLWSAVEEFIAEVEPAARVVPICTAGFTDSHWLRESFGTVAYGFFPMKAMTAALAARLVHSADERIEVDDLELGLVFLRHVAVSLGSRDGERHAP
jgi:acetylornithine deacetylase/succinyl-diaminopimelate desuccinylase-like protein